MEDRQIVLNRQLSRNAGGYAHGHGHVHVHACRVTACHMLKQAADVY